MFRPFRPFRPWRFGYGWRRPYYGCGCLMIVVPAAILAAIVFALLL